MQKHNLLGEHGVAHWTEEAAEQPGPRSATELQELVDSPFMVPPSEGISSNCMPSLGHPTQD